MFIPVATVEPFAGDGQSTAVNTAFATALKARVLGPCGELLSGLTVVFTAPSSGASATFPNGASAVTNAQGIATVNVSANGTAGTYQVTATTAGIPGVFSLTNTGVAQTAQTITFGPLGAQSYGATPFGISATATSGLTVSFASTTGSVCTISGTTVTIVAAGPCSITASQAGNASYSAAPNVIQGFTVSKAALTVTAQNGTITYPAASPAFSANLTGFVNGDLSTVVTGSPAFSNSATITNGKPNAGTWVITPSAGSLAASNYTFSFATGTLTVNQAPLSITASGQTITYGTAANLVAGAGTVTVTGLVNGDSGTATLSTNATVSFSFPNAGTWNIIPAVGTIPSGNYNVTLNNGILTVNKLAISVTAKPQTITYGNMANLVAGSGTVTVATLVTGDTSGPSLSTNAAVTNGNPNATNGTPWTITPSAGTISTSNYTFTFNNSSLTVNTSPLTVTATNASKAYGTTFAGTAFTAIGLLSGDSVSSLTLSSSGAAAAATIAGSPYSIIPSAAVGTGLANYAITYANGTLTVNGAPLIVTATNASKPYGTMFTPTAFTVSGLLSGDSVSNVTLSSSGAAAAATIAGSPYSIVPSAAVGTGLANYAITYVNGALTVNRAALTVTANNASRAYGALNPVFSAVLAGFVNGETSAVVIGAPALSTVAVPLTSNGAYPIVPAIGTLSAANYTFAFVNGTLTVTAGVLTVTANNSSKIYGEAVTFVGTEFAVGTAREATVTSVTLTSAGAAAPAGVAASPYAIVPSAAVGTGLENYTINYVNGTLTVTKARTSVVLISSGTAISATIVVAAPGAGIPTGTVQFLSGAAVLGTVTLVGGTASSPVPGGTVTAVYSGDGNFFGSTSSSATASAGAASSISLSSSMSPSTVGQSVTFTAFVRTSGAPGGPSGSVQFSDGGTLLGSVSLSTSSASYTTASLAGGSHTIVAQYGGDSTFPAAQATYGQFVTASATLSLTASPSASVYGQPVVLTATVGPSTTPSGFAPPSGQVSFSVGGTATLALGIASVTVTTLSVGADSISAQYNGDGTWPAASGTLNVTVSPALTATTLSLKMLSGQLALVATIAPVAPGAGVATGIVQFVNTANNTLVASGGLSNGSAAANVPTSVIGLPIVAVYGGDANFNGSSSATLPAAVNVATNLSTVFAPDEVTSLFNITGLGGNTSASLLLTTSLGGVTVTVTDSGGMARQAQLYGVFGSAGQINLVIPSATSSGPATVAITLPSGATVTTVIQVATTAPGIFTANMNGQGAYAGQVVYASPDGSQVIASSAVLDPATNQYVPNPIGLSPPGRQVYLVLYATGIRHAGSLTAAINGVNLPLYFFGAEGQSPGLDQINLQVPSTLAGSGLANLVITVDGQVANTVTVVLE